MSKNKTPQVPDTLPPAPNRRLYITRTIDDEAYADFTRELADLEAELSFAPIHLELCSEGGDDISGLAIADRIRCSSAPIHITCYGNANSAAASILASGDYRSMSPRAWVMMHESMPIIKNQRSSEAHRTTQEFVRREDQWCSIMAEYTGTPFDAWRKMIDSRETWLDAKECLQLGLVDQILKGKNRVNSLR